jgi:LysM repeat protein
MGSFVGSAHRHGRRKKFRRTGRHTTPSQVEKVAEKAGKAAPAMAISAGVLVSIPHGHHAVTAKHSTVATQSVSGKAGHAVTARLDSEVRPAQQQDRSYTVQSGDTLSSIAQQVYGNASDWAWLDHVNKSEVHDANLIYPGQVLRVPADPPANYTLPASATPAPSTSDTSGSDGAWSQAAPASGSSAGSGSQAASAVASPSANGSYSCNGLETLWEQAGGPVDEAEMAASIAMAESSGNPDAVSSTSDLGLWQINVAAHGSEATFDPLANAEAAVNISDDGSDWTPWVTFNTGAYSGRC